MDLKLGYQQVKIEIYKDNLTIQAENLRIEEKSLF